MIVLQISIVEGRLFLWGERAENGEQRRMRRRRGKRPPCPQHPRDAGREGIKAAVERAGIDIPIGEYRGPRFHAWIPANGNDPMPSSPALRESVVPSSAAAKLSPFTVTVAPLAFDDLLLFEKAEQADAMLGSGVLLGASVLFCSRIVRTALHLAAGERFLPGLVEHGSRLEAKWTPFPDDRIERDIARLASRLPASCRCLSNSTQAPPTDDPRRLVDSLLAEALDMFVRWSIPHDPIASETDAEKPADNIHDAWLNALCSGNPVFEWQRANDVRDFQAQLRRWAREAQLLNRSPFSLCFRLVEPDGDEVGGKRAWKVEYLLQPKADSSLLLPVGGLWKPASRAARQLRAYGEGSVEFILTALGQAAGLCPSIADSLQQQYPDGFETDNGGAWHFLREQAPALRSAGFNVMLPPWWLDHGPAGRLSATVRASSPNADGTGAGMFSLDSVASFDVTVSLGGDPMTVDELRALARLKSPLVNVRGQWTHVESADISAALRLLERRAEKTLSGRELLALALGAEKRIGGIEVAGVQLEGWIGDLVGDLSRREELTELAQPEGFSGTLRPYQVRGFSWLAFLRRWRLGACLADDMGLGKTIQALALFQHERNNGEKRPVLLVCPTSVLNNWRKEAASFTPELPVLIHHGMSRRKKAAFRAAARKHALVVTSYGLLMRDVDTLKEVDWAGAVFDEAQYIKNPDAKQSRAARAVKADYRVVMTGTPVENHVGDLWALMDLLNPGLLGARSAFTADFQKPIHVYGDAARADVLRAVTGPFILRRMKTDKSVISDLPDKIEMKEFCALTREQASLYEAVIEDMRNRLDGVEGIERRGVILATLTKLKQVCNHPAHFLKDNSVLNDRSGKLTRLREILLEIYETRERTLVFSQFAEMGVLLKRYVRDLFGDEVFFLHGGTPRAQRDEMVERFQNDEGAPRVFVLSLKAGGTGLNLTGANHVIHYDRWWNPAVENQATDRAYRIGQGRNVVVRTFVVAGTLEERIDSLIEKKTGIAEQVIGSGEQWLTELSNADLFELIRLGEDAIED